MARLVTLGDVIVYVVTVASKGCRLQEVGYAAPHHCHHVGCKGVL